jgi:hypothetical protein
MQCSVHDTKALEDQGVASVFVASDVFVGAAESQARSLGFEATPIYTQHPIQDRTDEEMVEIADKAIDEIVAKLTGQG